MTLNFNGWITAATFVEEEGDSTTLLKFSVFICWCSEVLRVFLSISLDYEPASHAINNSSGHQLMLVQWLRGLRCENFNVQLGGVPWFYPWLSSVKQAFNFIYIFMYICIYFVHRCNEIAAMAWIFIQMLHFLDANLGRNTWTLEAKPKVFDTSNLFDTTPTSTNVQKKSISFKKPAHLSKLKQQYSRHSPEHQ